MQTLWESSTANGFRIADRKEAGKEEALRKIELLLTRKKELQQEVIRITEYCVKSLQWNKIVKIILRGCS